MASAVPITNTLFPPPPGYYKAYTPEAVARLAALRSGAAEGDDEDAASTGAEEEELARALDPPRADWVLEEGHWHQFGEEYKALPHIPTARDLQLDPLVADPVSAGGDAERDTLPVLLHSFLHTLLALLDVLTGTARMPEELNMAGRASQGDQVGGERGARGATAQVNPLLRYIQHLSNLAATMMVSANQLRGVQAEATLVMLMEKQLAERREQTQRLRAKSREVAATIRRLKQASGAAISGAGGVDASAAQPLGDPASKASAAATVTAGAEAQPDTTTGVTSEAEGAPVDATAISIDPPAGVLPDAPPDADADITMFES